MFAGNQVLHVYIRPYPNRFSNLVEAARIELASANVQYELLYAYSHFFLHLLVRKWHPQGCFGILFRNQVYPDSQRWFPISLVDAPSQSERMKGWNGIRQRVPILRNNRLRLCLICHVINVVNDNPRSEIHTSSSTSKPFRPQIMFDISFYIIYLR